MILPSRCRCSIALLLCLKNINQNPGFKFVGAILHQTPIAPQSFLPQGYKLAIRIAEDGQFSLSFEFCGHHDKNMKVYHAPRCGCGYVYVYIYILIHIVDDFNLDKCPTSCNFESTRTLTMSCRMHIPSSGSRQLPAVVAGAVRQTAYPRRVWMPSIEWIQRKIGAPQFSICVVNIYEPIKHHQNVNDLCQ